MTGLREILERGLPDAPTLDGLAGRAESGARRRQVRRRAAVVVGAAVLVASVGVAGSTLRPDASTPPVADTSTTPSTSVTDPAPTTAATPTTATTATEEPSTAVPCGQATEVTRPGTVPVDGVVSVRFCEVAGATDRWLDTVPDTAVTTDLVGLIGRLDRAAEMDPLVDCTATLAASQDHEIQVAYADGTIRALSTLLTCGTSYREVMTAIAAQESADLPPSEPDALTCPPLSARDSFPPPLDPLLVLPTTEGLLCRYTGEPDSSGAAVATTLDQVDAEDWRLALLGAPYAPGMTRCGSPATDTVKLRLRTADGSVHEVTIGPCGDTYLDGQAAGIAGPGTFPSSS